MKASFEGKFVFEVEKLVVVACKGEGYSHIISGEKPITVLPDLGVTLEGRKLLFGKSMVVCIEERGSYVLVGPFDQSSLLLVKAAVKSDPSLIKLGEGLADLLNYVPDEGHVARFVRSIRLPSLRTTQGALVELWDAIKIKYPDKIEEILSSLSEAEKNTLDDLMAKINLPLK